jgi:CRP/FNR family transcriptional regulator, cyclic AMP receptor protein
MPGLMQDEPLLISPPRADAAWPRQLLAACPTWEVPAGKHVLLQGQASDVCFAVRSGMVELVRATGPAGAAVVDLLEPGQWIGLEQLLHAQPSAFSATTLCPSSLYVVRRPVLLDHLRRDPDASRWFCSTSAQRSVRIADWLVARTTCSKEDAVLWLLQTLAQRFGDPTGEGLCIRVPLRQAQLAALLGASRQLVNRVLGRLREQGAIAFVGQRILVKAPR